MSRHRLIPALDTLDASFDDRIQLHNWNLRSDYQTAPCNSVSLDMIWSTVEDLDIDYSLNLSLSNATAQRSITTAGGYDIATRQWQPGLLYLENRQLMIPCDAPAGNYDLLLTVYFYQTPDEQLAVRSPISAAGDTYYYLTTIHVNDE